MKEKLQNGGDDGETIDIGAEETSSGAGSSSHRVGSAAFEENVNDGRETRRGVREDSGNDSGHNSMMTRELYITRYTTASVQCNVSTTIDGVNLGKLG